MPITEPERIEGYWRRLQDESSHLPWPQPYKNWAGRDQFLHSLSMVEAKAIPVDFMGYSSCRLCGMQNGAVEFWFNSWAWPEGFRHYVADHDVRPSLDFESFVHAAK